MNVRIEYNITEKYNFPVILWQIARCIIDEKSQRTEVEHVARSIAMITINEPARERAKQVVKFVCLHLSSSISSYRGWSTNRDHLSRGAAPNDSLETTYVFT